jgi:ubiquinone/menaquinone biosynthesis C-methylase UbiE
MQPADYAYLYELEEDYWWFAGMRHITAALLDPLCPPHHDRLILDAGCGTGGMLAWLTRYAGKGRVAGIDLVDTALDFCRQGRHKIIAQASVESLPFAGSTFDLLTSFDVLVQLDGKESDQTAIREMYRVLKPGGLAFVRVAAHEWMKSSHDNALGSKHRYSLKELAGKMNLAGFEILHETYANSLPMPVAMFRRLVLKRLGLASGSDVKPLPSGWQWLNSAMTGMLKAEAFWLRRPGAKLFTGLSAICVAQKPLDAEAAGTTIEKHP